MLHWLYQVFRIFSVLSRDSHVRLKNIFVQGQDEVSDKPHRWYTSPVSSRQCTHPSTLKWEMAEVVSRDTLFGIPWLAAPAEAACKINKRVQSATFFLKCSKEDYQAEPGNKPFIVSLMVSRNTAADSFSIHPFCPVKRWPSCLICKAHFPMWTRAQCSTQKTTNEPTVNNMRNISANKQIHEKKTQKSKLIKKTYAKYFLKSWVLRPDLKASSEDTVRRKTEREQQTMRPEMQKDCWIFPV